MAAVVDLGATVRSKAADYNKISGSSLDQWVPRSLNTCHRLIYDALSSDAIEEVEFEDGKVVDRRWILHHFDFSSFRIFGFLDDFAMPTARPGSSATRRHDYESDIQRAFYRRMREGNSYTQLQAAVRSDHRLLSYGILHTYDQQEGYCH